MDINKDMIESYVKMYGSQDFNDIDGFLGHWQQNKEKLLMKLMGGELILEKEITVEKSYDEFEREFADLIYDDGYYREGFIKDLVQKIKDADKYSTASKLGNLISSRALFSNSVNEYLEYASESDRTFELPNDKEFKIKKDEKLMRVLRKLAVSYDLEVEFESFRLTHSLILNDKSLSGTLCLSIHPMDFITMSDNNCGWSTCMSWQEGGCYKVGSMEMMNSSGVLITYLKSSTSTLKFNDYEWNSKKWRELIMVTPDLVMNNKPYPYRHEQLNTIALDWVRELMQQNLNIEMEDKLLRYDDGECEDGTCFGIEVGTFMYNDYHNDNGFSQIYKRKNAEINRHIHINGEGFCLKCGKPLNREDDFICDDCRGVKICADCDERMFEDDEKIFIDGKWYCSHCAEEHIVHECVVCGKQHDHSRTVKYHSPEVKYDNVGVQMCGECLLEYNRNKMSESHMYSRYYHIAANRLTEAEHQHFKAYIDARRPVEQIA